MDLGISGRVAVICASSRGLGRACATALANAGCEVVINGRNPETLELAADEIRKASGSVVHTVAADVTTKEGQALLVSRFPNVDILITNADGPPPSSYRNIDRDGLMKGVVSNMITPIELIQSLAPGMVERGFGRIVNITSASVKTPLTGLDLSSGARAGLTAFLGGVSRELAEANVTINHILPGMFDTDRLASATTKIAAMKDITPEAVRSSQLSSIPARRLGNPSEFGALCAFLCSAHAGYLVGQNFVIDGGSFASNF